MQAPPGMRFFPGGAFSNEIFEHLAATGPLGERADGSGAWRTAPPTTWISRWQQGRRKLACSRCLGILGRGLAAVDMFLLCAFRLDIVDHVSKFIPSK